MKQVAPAYSQGNYGNSTYEESRHLCSQRRYARIDFKAALKRRLSTMGAIERKWARDKAGVMETLAESIGVCEKRCRAGALPLAFVSGKRVVKRRAQWWDTRMKDKWGALEGIDGAISARTAVQCGKPVTQELLPEEDRGHAALFCPAKGRGLSARGTSKVFLPLKDGDPSTAVVDSRWATMLETADGERAVMARLVAKGFQVPDFASLVETSGCVRLMSAHI